MTDSSAKRPFQDIPQGSIETGIRGEYELPIRQVFAAAWQNVEGLKKPFVMGQLYVVCWLLLIMLVGMLCLIVLGLIPMLGPIANILFQVVIYAFTLTFAAYLNQMAVSHLLGHEVTEKGIFKYFKYLPRMIGPAIVFGVMNFLICLVFAGGAFLFGIFATGHGAELSVKTLLFMMMGVVCLILFYLFLSVLTSVFNCALVIAIDRDIKPLKAAHIYFLVLLRRLPQVMGINILCGLILALSCIPLGIPLIWTAPWVFSVNAVVIKRSIGLLQQ